MSFFFSLAIGNQASGEAVSYQKCSGLDILCKRNQEGVERRGQTILYCRGAGIGTFPPLTGYTLLQSQAVRSIPVSICLELSLLIFIGSTGKKSLTKAVTNANMHLEYHSWLVSDVEAWLMRSHWSSCHWHVPAPAQSSEQHKVQCWQLDSDKPGSPHQCKSNVMTFVRRIITTITASWS